MQEAVKYVVENEEELEQIIVNLRKYSDNKVALKHFYNQQLNFLKQAKKNKEIDEQTFVDFHNQLNSLLKQNNIEIDEILNDNYSIGWYKYNKSVELKKDVDYVQLKTEFEEEIQLIESKNLAEEESKTAKRDVKRYTLILFFDSLDL